MLGGINGSNSAKGKFYFQLVSTNKWMENKSLHWIITM